MGKLSIPRLALAMTIFGIFLLPPTDSFAAKTWLEKKLEQLFSSPQQKAPKHRKPRPAKKVATPLTAPVPEAKPDNETPPVDDEGLPQSSDVIPVPKDNPQAAAPVTKPAGPVQGPPMPQPKPAVPADSVPDDAGATLPENADAVPIPEPNPRATSEDKQPSQRPAGPVQGPPIPPALEASPQDEAPPETVPIPEPNPRTATEKPDETAPAENPPSRRPPPDPRSALPPRSIRRIAARRDCLPPAPARPRREVRQSPGRSRPDRLFDPLSCHREIARHEYRAHAGCRDELRHGRGHCPLRQGRHLAGRQDRCSARPLKSISQASGLCLPPAQRHAEAFRARLRQCARHLLLHALRRHDGRCRTGPAGKDRRSSSARCAAPPADRSRPCSAPADRRPFRASAFRPCATPPWRHRLRVAAAIWPHR